MAEPPVEPDLVLFPPENFLPASQLAIGETDTALTNLKIFAYVDATSVTTTLSVAHGTLTIAAIDGTAVSGSGTGTVTLTGTAKQINATLMAAGNVIYHSAPGFSGPDTLTFVTNDGYGWPTGPLTDTDTASIDVIFHDFVLFPPENFLPASQLAIGETDTALTGLKISAYVDANSVTTTLSVLHGTLTIAAIDGATVSGSGTDTVTLSGTAKQINATLMAAGNVIYHSDPGFSGPDTLTFVTNDGYGWPAGPLTDTDTGSIDVIFHDTVTTTSQVINNEDGSRIVLTWDVQNQVDWANYYITYDSQNHVTGQVTRNDDSSYIVQKWDAADAQDWADYYVTYDGQDRPTTQVTNTDDGSRMVFKWDVANTAEWSDYYVTYDGQNRPITQVTHNDDGSQIVIKWDVANQSDWSHYYVTSDSLGRAVNQVTTNDDGTHLTYAWDVADQASWSDYVVTADSQNRATEQTTHYDNGTYTIDRWDVQDQSNWQEMTDTYDAQGHHLQQRGVYDDGTSWLA
jgi:hypothetical protein